MPQVDQYKGCWDITVSNQTSGISYFEITNETWYKNGVQLTESPEMYRGDEVSFEATLDGGSNFGSLEYTQLKVSFLKGKHKPFNKWELTAESGSGGATTLSTTFSEIKLNPGADQKLDCAFDIEVMLRTPDPSDPSTTTQNFTRVLLDPVIIVGDRPPEGG